MIYGTDYQNYGVYYNHNILNTIVGSDMKSLLSLQYNNIIQNHNYSSYLTNTTTDLLNTLAYISI